MSIYKVSWPNGHRTIVAARNKENAIMVLDEQGAASKDMIKQAVQPNGSGFAFDVVRTEIPCPGEEPDVVYEIHPYEEMAEMLEDLFSK